MSLVVNVLLALLVGVVWLGCLSFARLRTPLDRLHCAAFVNVAAGAVLMALGFAADGLSTRALKIVLTVGVAVLGGSVLSHAVARAMLYRDRFGHLGRPPS